MQTRSTLLKVSIFLNYCVFAILLNSVGTVILQVQSSFGVSESAASVLEAYKDLSIAIASFLVAAFITRLGYKRSMLVALAAVFLMSIAMPQLPAFWMNKLMFAVTGVSFALVKVSVFATLGLIADDKREHVSLMNFLEAFFMVGVLSGYFLFSAYVDDNQPGSLAWFNVYYLLAALTAVAFVTLLITPLDESEAKYPEDETAGQSFVNMLALGIRPLVLTFVISVFLYVLIEQGIMSWLPTFNNTILNLPASLSIQMTSILAASIALGRFIAGYAAKKIAWYPMLCGCLVLAAILVLTALPLADNQDPNLVVTGWSNAPLAAFVFPLIGLCLSPIYPVINSVILSALPKNQHAPMTGLIVVFSALGGTCGSIITGALFEAFDGSTAFYFSLVPMAAILIALYLFKRQTDSATAPSLAT